MTRRTKRRCLLLGILLLSGRLEAQPPDLAKVEMKPTKLVEGVWMLEGAGGNIGVSAGSDGVVLIDDQFAPLSEKLKAAVAKLSSLPIRFVLNTHWHGDHTGGNETLARSGALIVAHDNVRKRLAAGAVIELLKKEIPPAPKDALPIVTFSQDVTFHLNGDELHAFHVQSSHTDGDVVIHFKKTNVYHTGDVFNTSGYPYIDAYSGGSIDGLIAVAGDLLGQVDGKSRLIPGHGPPGDRRALQEYRAMLLAIRDRVDKLVRQGKTIEQAVSAQPTKEFDARWGGAFLKGEEFTRLVYTSLAGKPAAGK